MLINLCAELEESRKDNSIYTHYIADPEYNLATANTTTCILQTTATHATLPIFKPIEVPHPPEFSGDCMELLHFISKVRSKLARESLRYIDEQYKVHYIYGFLKGNTQNQIEPYILADRINFENIEELIGILNTAFGDPDQVGGASVELDKLTHGGKEFSQCYAKFQCLMAILDYDTNVKKAALKHGLLGLDANATELKLTLRQPKVIYGNTNGQFHGEGLYS
jgi:hypothetical protein